MPSVTTSCNTLNLRIESRIPISSTNLTGLMNGTVLFNDIRLQEVAKPHFSEDKYQKFTIPELKERARLRNIPCPSNVNKSRIAEILVAADQVLLKQLQEHQQQNEMSLVVENNNNNNTL
jgi:hypothetical protein